MSFSLTHSGRRVAAWTGFVLAFALLTALTQIGGLILLLSIALARFRHWNGWITGGLFCCLYLVANTLVLPLVAPIFGREPLPCFSTAQRPYQAQSPFYCIANRNYLRPSVKAALSRIANNLALQFPGTVVTYLDASFPFVDGFPLPPHLSHKDGRKIDLALFYRDQGTAGAWFLSYWAFSDATGFVSPCAQDGFFRWNMAWLQPFLPRHELDDQRTRALIEVILSQTPQKILVEPHIVQRLHLDQPGIMFAGCHAARHDDHIHVQWQ